jgi:hypothetical protein
MTYAEWLAAVSNLLVIDPADADFLAYAPRAIEYAEQRMYRELDLLYTYTTSDAGSFVAGTRTFTLPADTIVVNNINVITPTATAPDSGVRNPMAPVSREWLDAVYGSNASGLRGLPQYFAMLTNTTIAVGPWPDAAYHVEVARTTRPAALSSGNTTTILTLYLPDAFLSASMIAWAGYQRDYGAQTDGPQDSASWEKQYAAQMASATVEAFRQKFLSASATSKSTSPALNTQRG